MGVISGLMTLLFGSDRNVIAETAEVFRENAEKAGVRNADAHAAVLQQFAAEFAHPRKGLFDRFIDGLNRLPRPMMALGTLGLFIIAMRDPVWFSERMQGLAVVPEPLWWLMGAIVSFYFGARQQVKGHEFQQSIAQTLARAGAAQAPVMAKPAIATLRPRTTDRFSDNPALAEWKAQSLG